MSKAKKLERLYYLLENILIGIAVIFGIVIFGEAISELDWIAKKFAKEPEQIGRIATEIIPNLIILNFIKFKNWWNK